MNGFLLVDKPVGCTSFDVVAMCRKIFHEKKIGHSGTLDPFATGLLILALGEATKLLEYLPSFPKVYSGSGVFGTVSDTLDCDGTHEVRFPENVIRDRLSLDMIKKCVHQKFIGKILQTPPIYSALKIYGVPAYKKARRGEKFSLKPREIEVFDFQILDIALPTFSFRCSVTGGTYIRSLIASLGDELGVGAYTLSLRREFTSGFSLTDAISLEALRSYSGDSSELLLPLDRGIAHMPRIDLSDHEYRRLANGQTIERSFSPTLPVFSAYCSGIFVGILESLAPKCLKFRKLIHISHV